MTLVRTSRGGLIDTEKFIDAVSIPLSTDSNADVNVESADELVVDVRMTTGTVGDLVVSCRPYEPDNTTLFNLALPAVESVAPVVAGADVVAHYRFDVSAYRKVQLRVRNASATNARVTTAVRSAATSDAI